MKFIKLHIAASGQVFWVNAGRILEMFPQGPEGKSGTKLYYVGGQNTGVPGSGKLSLTSSRSYKDSAMNTSFIIMIFLGNIAIYQQLQEAKPQLPGLNNKVASALGVVILNIFAALLGKGIDAINWSF